jgi:predicted transcriptional regulator
MAETTEKQKAVKAVQELPPDATFEDAMERLYFLCKIEKGIRQADAGRTVSHAQAKKRMKKWRL